jgi:hypothetical protein
VTFVVDNRTRSRVRRKQLRWFRTASLRQKWKRIWKPKRMWLSRRLAHPLPHHRLHLSEWTRFACNKCWATWWHLFWSAEILQNDVRLKRHDDLDCHDDLDSERKERLLWLWNIEKQKTKKPTKQIVWDAGGGRWLNTQKFRLHNIVLLNILFLDVTDSFRWVAWKCGNFIWTLDVCHTNNLHKHT